MLHEINVQGVDIILNNHMHMEPRSFSEGRYITREELDDDYPRAVSERFFDEDRSDEFKAWGELDNQAQQAVFNYIVIDDYTDYGRLEAMLPRLMKS